jgi:hypothetical protein
MNPQSKLHRDILDALKEFPGIDRIAIRSGLHGILVNFQHSGISVNRQFVFSLLSEAGEEFLREFLGRRFDEMARSVRPDHPGPGAAWGWSKFP